MVFIYHGENQAKSREAFNLQLDNSKGDVLRLESSNLNLDQINNYLCGTSLFGDQKTIGFSNFFSITKTTQDKLLKIIFSSTTDIVVWQDKKLTIAQLKLFPQAKVTEFKLSKQLFNCIFAIKPKNSAQFISLYHQVIKDEPFELFLYLLKSSIRKQLTTYSRFTPSRLSQYYLDLINLEYSIKTGKNSAPKEILLENLTLKLLSF